MRTIQHIARRLPALILVLGALATTARAGNDWDWHLPKEDFKLLNQFERAQYQKAMKLFDKGQETRRHHWQKVDTKAFKSAAAEWEKFRTHYGDTAILPYVVFMQAHSLHFAKLRHEAIKKYTEVLDYFGDEIWVAAPAQYWRGIAHFDNGDDRQGYKDMQAMVEDPDYKLHPLAAGAFRRLADNHARNNEMPQAIKYWKETYEVFAKNNWDEAKNARNKVIGEYVKDQRYDLIVGWLAPGDKRDDANRRRGIASAVRDVAYHGFGGDWGVYKGTAGDKQKKEDIKAFLDWYTAQRKYYEQTNKLWDYFRDRTYFLVHRWRDQKLIKPLVEEAANFIAAQKWEEKDKNKNYSWMIDRCREAGNGTLARLLIERMTDRPYALWKKYELVGHSEHKWNDAVKILENIEALKSDHWSGKARYERAKVYEERLRNYEQAINIYQEINSPPGTLWRIQHCYRKWGKADKALATLKQLVGMFPGEAAEAMYHIGLYQHQDGQIQNAISAYRQILKHPEWKKSGAASKAHQKLEELGIETGGGVQDEEL